MTVEITPEVRAGVEAVLYRYATGIDTRDWALFRTCFTDDCEADYGTIGAWHGADEITEWMRVTHEPCGHTLHRITNPSMAPDGSGIAVRSYVDALVMFGDNQTGTRAAGSYEDAFVLDAGCWQIARRRFTIAIAQWVPDGRVLDLDRTGERA